MDRENCGESEGGGGGAGLRVAFVRDVNGVEGIEKCLVKG